MNAPKITTVERHFLDRKGNNPHATAEFSWLLSGITLATKIISAHVRRAALLQIMGETGHINVQGEVVQKLDVFANETLCRCLGYRGNIGILVSEEDEEPHVIQEAASGKYIVLLIRSMARATSTRMFPSARSFPSCTAMRQAIART
jgi:fructose-1,6-bisphosphatase I